MFKFIVTSLNNILKVLDSFVESFAGIPLILATSMFAFKKKFSFIENLLDISKDNQKIKKWSESIKSSFRKMFTSIQKEADNTPIKVSVKPIKKGKLSTTEEETASKTGFATSIASFAKITAISLAIAGAIKLIQLAMESFFMRVQKAKDKVSELSEQYNNVKDELDSINSKLEENQQRIDEINANGLDFAGEELEKLQKQNEELRLQKQYLEDIEEIKKKQLNNATQDLLDLKTYSSFNEKDTKDSVAWEQLRNGQYGKALGTLVGLQYNEKDNSLFKALKNVFNFLNLGLDDIIYGAFFKTDKNITAQDYAQEQIDKINKLLEEKNKILNSSEGLDYTTYIETNKQISEMNKSLTEAMAYLTEQQKTLDENSKLYKEINDLVEQYSKVNDNIKINASGFIDLTLDTYFDGENFDEKTFKKVQKKLQNKNLQSAVIGKNFNSQLSTDVQNILSKNGIAITSSSNPSSTASSVEAQSYVGIINALEEINALKEQGVWIDNYANNTIEKTLAALIDLTDEERDYVELASKLDTYNFINGFVRNNDLGINNLSNIAADTYITFKDALIAKAEEDGQDTQMIEAVLANLFPDYQTVEGRLSEYIKSNPTSELSKVVNDYSNGKGLPIKYSDQLIDVFNNLGMSADGAAGYIHKLANEITNEEIAALKSATNQAQQEFVNNQTDFNDNFSNTKDTFVNAISNISSGSAISYEDMWTLINADSELATKFKKSANGYTIAIEDLTEAQEKYSEETKNTYLKAIEDAQKRIDEAQSKKKALGQQLSRTNNGYDAKIISEQIKECNDEIQINTELIAKNQLMYEQASDSMFKYGEQLEKAVSKLSTFKSLYSGILNDMASIGRIGAENLVQIMQTFPEDWQTLITKSASGKGFEINKQAYKDRVVRELGFSGGDKETISQDMFNNLETELDSLAKQYGITYNHGVSFEEQLEKVKKTAAVNGQSGFKDFSDRLNKINEGFENIDESASVVAEVIRTLFEIFKEDEALTDFNNAIDDLDYKLSTGQINQALYDDGVRQANDDYKKAVDDPDDPNTKKQLRQNEIDIYTADQNKYQKELDKKTQDLQDAYDRRLISAKDYYKQLAEFEDKYYGTETKKGLLNDPDGTNVANKNRQQLERRKSLFNDEVSRAKDDYSKRYISFDDYKKQYENAIETWLGGSEEFKEVYKEANLEFKVTLVNDEIEKIKTDYSRGLMTFEEFETALGNSLDYWLGNVEELKDTYNELERENISALYEEEIKLSDQALERGEKTNYEYAQDMINIWKKYYKDKDRYRQEDIASERQAVEASKQAVQSQIDAFQHLIDKNNDDAEGQINELQDQKDKIERKYDKQIKTLQKQKDLISDAVDKEDRRLKLLEAQKELQKTKQNSRQVYGSDGSITYKPDTEKSKEAQKSYNDAITSEILNLMQDDIDVLEKQKEKETEPINNKILEIEQKRDEANKFLKAIVDMLGTILEDTYDINAEYVKRLLESDDAKAELDKINKEREQAGEDPISWSDISSLIETSKEEIDKETSQEEQENFLLNTTSETKDDRKGNSNSTDSTRASGTYIDKSFTKENAKHADPLTASESRINADKSITKDNAKSEDSKTTDNSENDKITGKNNIESTNNVFDINDYFSKLEKLLGTPIPVTITDNIKKNIDNANQRVQSDIEQINTNNNTGNSLTFTGDIVINNPIGNSDDLAKELMMNLPNAFQKQIYTNLQR